MAQKQKQREKGKKKEEKFVVHKADDDGTGSSGGDEDEQFFGIDAPTFDNQYTISCGADEYVLPSTGDMSVAELRSFIQMNRPGGMHIEGDMPCFVNGDRVENEGSMKLQGNLRVEFTKKAGVKGL
jgi:hypothetical protein